MASEIARLGRWTCPIQRSQHFPHDQRPRCRGGRKSALSRHGRTGRRLGAGFRYATRHSHGAGSSTSANAGAFVSLRRRTLLILDQRPALSVTAAGGMPGREQGRRSHPQRLHEMAADGEARIPVDLDRHGVGHCHGSFGGTGRKTIEGAAK